MKTTTHYIMNTEDVKALTRAAEIIATITETFFNSHGGIVYSVDDLKNLANIASGLEPVDLPYRNCTLPDMRTLKERITVVD